MKKLTKEHLSAFKKLQSHIENHNNILSFQQIYEGKTKEEDSSIIKITNDDNTVTFSISNFVDLFNTIRIVIDALENTILEDGIITVCR